MSEQYQRFKQNFFKQHPPSAHQSKNFQQSANRSHKQYDPYKEYSSVQNNMYHNQSEQNLRIQNQTHFPFEDIEQATFQQLQSDPFWSNNKQQNHNNLQKSINQNYIQNNRNQFHDNDFRNYVIDRQYQEREIPIKTQSQLEYTTIPKQDFSHYQRPQQTQIDKINQELNKIKITRQQNFHQPSNQIIINNEFQQRKIPSQNLQKQSLFQPQNYQINKQYVVQNNRINYQSPNSPPKQLPIIYNRPNSLNNSQHKINQQTLSPNNSRIIIQQSPPFNQGSLLLSPPLNPNHPVNINQMQIPNQMPPNISSGSRVLIQSEMLGQNKGTIPSNTNSPSGYNLPPQTFVISHPPMNLEGQNRNIGQGMVPLKQYQRMRTECMTWQQKFYQANDQLSRLQFQRGGASYNQGVSQQIMIVREQNNRLMQKIRVLQNSDKNSYDKIKVSYEQLMKKYQESLMKECNLLIDRFRLQMKHNQRY